jgi:hypothetical protein
MLNLHGWDMHDVQVELRNKSFYQILDLYKQKDKISTNKSVEYLQAMSDDNSKAVKRLEEEITHLEKEKCVIALHITKELTKENKAV